MGKPKKGERSTSRLTQSWNWAGLCRGERELRFESHDLSVYGQHPFGAMSTMCLQLCSVTSTTELGVYCPAHRLPFPGYLLALTYCLAHCKIARVCRAISLPRVAFHIQEDLRSQPLDYLGFVPACCKTTTELIPWGSVEGSSPLMFPRDWAASHSPVRNGSRARGLQLFEGIMALGLSSKTQKMLGEGVC